MKIRMVVATCAVVLFATAAYAAEAQAPVKYPADYRMWTHVKSMLIYSDKHPLYASFGGIHHIYVNKTGFAAAKAQEPYPDGSILVFDLRTIHEDNGAYIEGARKVVAVMQKDSKRFKNTGGWGFEAFKANGGAGMPLVKDPAGQCFSCHTSQKEHDFVFSRFDD